MSDSATQTDPSAAPLVFGYGEGNRAVVLLPDGREFADLPALLAALPSLKDPGQAAWLARAVNQFEQGIAYEVILDPAAFEAHCRKRLAAEDPNEPWREGVNRLGDYGVPDFAAIGAPARVGEGLRYFAAERMLGLPYGVDMPSLDAAPVYEPVRLEPLPAAAPESEPATADRTDASESPVDTQGDMDDTPDGA